MYKYKSVVRIEEAIELCEPFKFEIVLRENTIFKMADCYFEVKKNHDFQSGESDHLVVLYFSNHKNINLAKEKIKRAIELFIFMTGIPFAVNSFIVENVTDDIPAIDVNRSKKKMLNLQECNKAYTRVRKKKKLLHNVLKLYAVAIKEDFLLAGNKEDAFFTYFKIIEIIVKDEFSIEKNNIDKGQDCTKGYIIQMLNNIYGIETQEKRLNELEGIIRQTLFQQTFDNIYHKIMWFLKRKNIFESKDAIASIVSLRNDIAHEENVVIEDNTAEYRIIIELVRKVIETKFFGRNMKIECRQNIF